MTDKVYSLIRCMVCVCTCLIDSYRHGEHYEEARKKPALIMRRIARLMKHVDHVWQGAKDPQDRKEPYLRKVLIVY